MYVKFELTKLIDRLSPKAEEFAQIDAVGRAFGPFAKENERLRRPKVTSPDSKS
jgi:hypothetical protein